MEIPKETFGGKLFGTDFLSALDIHPVLASSRDTSPSSPSATVNPQSPPLTVASPFTCFSSQTSITIHRLGESVKKLMFADVNFRLLLVPIHSMWVDSEDGA